MIYGSSLDKINEYLADVYDFHESSLAQGEPVAITYTLKSNRVVIGLTTKDPSIILHECIHCAYSVRNLLGLSDDEELMAYLIE